MQFANGVASLRVGGSRYRACIHNNNICIGRLLGRNTSAPEQLPLERCAIGLRRATAKLFDVKRGHRGHSTMRL